MLDQRRAQMTAGTDRLRNLENIYLKGNLTANKPPTTITSSTGYRPSNPYPRAASATHEYVLAKQRHSKFPGTTSNSKQLRIGLRKQNFVEDGQNIMAGPVNLQVKHRLLHDNSSPDNLGRDSAAGREQEQSLVHDMKDALERIQDAREEERAKLMQLDYDEEIPVDLDEDDDDFEDLG